MKAYAWVVTGCVCLFGAWVIAQTLSAQGTPTSSLTVATYNVQNFLDEFDDPYSLDERTPAKPREQIVKIARTIRQLNADIVALQEVENEGFLRAVVKKFLSDMGYAYVVVGQTNSVFGQNLGVISRKPIVSVTSHRFMPIASGPDADPVRFTRDLMRVEVQATPTRRLHLLIVHLKSRHDAQGDPQSIRRRSAEAAAVRKAVERLLVQDPDAWVLAMGDFNATPGSQEMKVLLTPSPGGRPLLLDAHHSLTPAKRVTYLLKPYRSTVDYILATPALADRIRPGSARVLQNPSILTGSDHTPVSVAFDLAAE